MKIECSSVTKKYGRLAGVKELDLHLDRTGICGVIGENGSGKSTLLKLLTGLLRPTEGTVTIDNAAAARNGAVDTAYLSEEDALYRYFSVEETIDFMSRIIPDFNKETALGMAREMNLPFQQKVKTLSRGNRARLKIAAAASRSAPLICMDEPLSGLDPVVREDILQMIIRYIDMDKQLVLLSTHEVREVEPYLDHVLFLHDGKIVVEGDTETLKMERQQSLTDILRTVMNGCG
ncbi:ATP-binding cassette domain-containing protein [Alkalicoccus urumqiensis]|uniref:ABC transporter ATP-binding protein n=1 Tax=Alkalicoccus urumqiensis TaxID=1548213 RepID=A0A2P6MGF6_ALKUR|nr:ABC transporter ATP-binding protein [Alkalicoccus urumqiensis]PRO65366.1 ABC transporter ATP-binding protein [Alkalicoccus urumqiensis]